MITLFWKFVIVFSMMLHFEKLVDCLGARTLEVDAVDRLGLEFPIILGPFVLRIGAKCYARLLMRPFA
jgi:hypothetical protein